MHIEELIKIIGIGLIGIIAIAILKQYRPEYTIYISLLAGILIIFITMDKLSGIVNLLTSISEKASINNTYIKILLKITGIAILSEFAVSVCKDSGENSIASKIELGSKVIIISMSIPIISNLLDLIVKILP